MSDFQSSRIHSKKELKIRSENGIKTRKSVLQYSLDNKFIKEYESINKAALEVKIDRRNISSCLTLRRPNYNTAGGFKWRYKQ